MWQVEILMSGMERMIVGPFPDDQEEEAHAVHRAWQGVVNQADMIPNTGDFKIHVALKKYTPLLPSTDVGWLWSRYAQPAMLDHRGS